MILPQGKFDRRGVFHSTAEAKYRNDKLKIYIYFRDSKFHVLKAGDDRR